MEKNKLDRYYKDKKEELIKSINLCKSLYICSGEEIRKVNELLEDKDIEKNIETIEGYISIFKKRIIEYDNKHSFKIISMYVIFPAICMFFFIFLNYNN